MDLVNATKKTGISLFNGTYAVSPDQFWRMCKWTLPLFKVKIYLNKTTNKKALKASFCPFLTSTPFLHYLLSFSLSFQWPHIILPWTKWIFFLFNQAIILFAFMSHTHTYWENCPHSVMWVMEGSDNLGSNQLLRWSSVIQA